VVSVAGGVLDVDGATGSDEVAHPAATSARSDITRRARQTIR
jgi:hypothetical protein